MISPRMELIRLHVARVAIELQIRLLRELLLRERER
jgi:hypothetical protein